MRTTVNIGPASKSTMLPEKQLRNPVISKQNAPKAYTDVRRGARVPRIKEGSLVRVRKPFHVKKGLSKVQGPARAKVQRTSLHALLQYLSLHNRWMVTPTRQVYPVSFGQSTTTQDQSMQYAGVVGAADGTHIQIIAPSKDEDVFVNRNESTFHQHADCF
ncbi:hypothetical protein N1851_030482 [Merluccius polli]|uniref:Uncharacterized protein n=1 Tax=Merluccius polli TaxID=89951 RepID=A0AA47M5M2_MERPO|nr:hypothetical protein N1851_030482 [Merluccius polli]